jgi:hypothetical protein
MRIPLIGMDLKMSIYLDMDIVGTLFSLKWENFQILGGFSC